MEDKIYELELKIRNKAEEWIMYNLTNEAIQKILPYVDISKYFEISMAKHGKREELKIKDWQKLEKDIVRNVQIAIGTIAEEEKEIRLNSATLIFDEWSELNKIFLYIGYNLYKVELSPKQELWDIYKDVGTSRKKYEIAEKLGYEDF